MRGMMRLAIMGVPGAQGGAAPTTGNRLLLENGEHLLLENGEHLLLENADFLAMEDE